MQPGGAIRRREDFVAILQELHDQIAIKLDVFHYEDLFMLSSLRCGF